MKALLLAPLLLSSVAAQVLAPLATQGPTPLGPIQRIFILGQQASTRREQLGGQFGGAGFLQAAPSPQVGSQLNNVIPPSQSLGSQSVPSTQSPSGKQPMGTPAQAPHPTSGQQTNIPNHIPSSLHPAQHLNPSSPRPTQNLNPSPPRPTQNLNPSPPRPTQNLNPSPPRPRPLPHATVTQSGHQPQTPHSHLPHGTGHQVNTQVPPQLSLAQRRGLCGKLPDPGECRGAFPRYYYNVETSQCDCFLYGGCGDLGSTYATLKECREVCAPAILSEGPSCKFIFQEEEDQFFFPPLHQGPTTTAQVNKTTSQQDNRTPQVGQPSGGVTSPSGEVASPSGGVASPSGGANPSGVGTNPIGGVANQSGAANASGVEADSSERGSVLHPLCGTAPDCNQCRDFFPRYYYNRTTGQCSSSVFIYCEEPDQVGFATQSECTNTCGPSNPGGSMIDTSDIPDEELPFWFV